MMNHKNTCWILSTTVWQHRLWLYDNSSHSTKTGRNYSRASHGIVCSNTSLTQCLPAPIPLTQSWPSYFMIWKHQKIIHFRICQSVLTVSCDTDMACGFCCNSWSCWFGFLSCCRSGGCYSNSDFSDRSFSNRRSNSWSSRSSRSRSCRTSCRSRRASCWLCGLSGGGCFWYWFQTCFHLELGFTRWCRINSHQKHKHSIGILINSKWYIACWILQDNTQLEM